MPAYLESSNPANTALYQRFGFERLGVIRVGRSRTHGPHAAHRTMIDVEGWVQRKTQLLAQYNRAALVEANEVKDVLVSPTLQIPRHLRTLNPINFRTIVPMIADSWR